MAVIITNMDMPKACNKCENKNCNYYHRAWWNIDDKSIDNTTSRHPKCPLKSTDEMIADIEKLHAWGDQFGNVYVLFKSVMNIIHKYCDKEIEDEDDD